MRVFRIREEAGYLGEMGLITLHRVAKEKDFVKKKVKTLTGISLRTFVKIPIEVTKKLKNGKKSITVRDAWVDWVTGTLYEMDGKCISSSQLQIVNTSKKPYCSIKDMMDKFKFGHGEEYEYGSSRLRDAPYED